MILFVFEGEKREPNLFRTINHIFLKLKEEDAIVCSYGNNIYNLYGLLKEMGEGADIVSVMKSRDKQLQNRVSSDFSEIYLFFDYDIHGHVMPMDELNCQVRKMLQYFEDETDNRKLYINYPMVESIYYTKNMPDCNYYKYTVTREECYHFKRLASEFSVYKNFGFITKRDTPETLYNWKMLKQQNVMKAYYICTHSYQMPTKKEDITQRKIFEAQLERFVNQSPCCISILNAFPLFLYEYLKN